MVEVTTMLAVLDDPNYAVCLNGRWCGWLFRKHPGGHWVISSPRGTGALYKGNNNG